MKTAKGISEFLGEKEMNAIKTDFKNTINSLNDFYLSQEQTEENYSKRIELCGKRIELLGEAARLLPEFDYSERYQCLLRECIRNGDGSVPGSFNNKKDFELEKEEKPNNSKYLEKEEKPEPNTYLEQMADKFKNHSVREVTDIVKKMEKNPVAKGEAKDFYEQVTGKKWNKEEGQETLIKLGISFLSSLANPSKEEEKK